MARSDDLVGSVPHQDRSHRDRIPSLTNATLAPSPLLHRRFLQHNLPFWMASLVERLLVLLIPIVAVLYPLMRFLPALYGWLMRRKIARLYGELRFLEDEITGGGGPTDAAQLMARLDQHEKQANQLRMPIAYESMMYLLRNHISAVRNRLAAGQP